jgi:iron-sulfur cluster insertion protein|tara:strand:+ start:214 stop:522 length:309 start_codon:yes stop_codon:yes gene_type:complete
MINITDEALNHIESIAKDNNKKFVRLDLKGGGCAGFEYAWSFEDEEQRNDMIVKDVLLIDRMHELYLLGMELDFKKDIFGSQFEFNNPNAKSSCGCGTSFSL